MKITLSKSQWTKIGTKAGWFKAAQTDTQDLTNQDGTVDQIVNTIKEKGNLIGMSTMKNLHLEKYSVDILNKVVAKLQAEMALPQVVSFVKNVITLIQHAQATRANAPQTNSI